MSRKASADELKSLFPVVFSLGWIACALVLLALHHVDGKKHQAKPEDDKRHQYGSGPNHPAPKSDVGPNRGSETQERNYRHYPSDDAGNRPQVELRLPNGHRDQARNQREECRD